MNQIEIDEAMVKAVRNKARELKQNRAFRDLEEEDIEQELYLELCRRMGEYNPERSPKMAFVRMVLCGKAAKLLRKHTSAAETAWREARSLDVVVGYCEDGTAETVGDLRENPASRAERVDRDFLLDQEAMMYSLPERLQPAFRMLVLEGNTQSEAAERMGLVLTTFRDRFLYPLREELAQCGAFPSIRDGE